MGKQQIKVGDTVKLVSLKQASFEYRNWILDGTNNPAVGDEFIVEETDEDNYIRVKGLSYMHPTTKFELI